MDPILLMKISGRRNHLENERF